MASRPRRTKTFLADFLLGLLLSLPPSVDAQSAPGLKAVIDGVKLDAERRSVVTFKLSDSQGKPLDLNDLDPNSVKFTIAAIKEDKNDATRYHNYILTKVSGKEFVYKGETKKPTLTETLQPDFDQSGTLKQVRPGILTYTFKTALPSDFDRNATHVVGGEVTRENGKYVANPIFEFVPSGAKVKVQRSVVETASCNNCHDPLKAHGGTRREVGTCALCHTSQLTDPESGENLDFKVFVHRIHRGKLLPSVKEGKPYFIVGANQSVKDYSSIRYPQVMLSGGSYQELRNCQACHANPQKDHWKKFPSTAACTSCHNNVDLTSGKNHKLGPMADGTCIGCHPPNGPEFGPAIAGAHTFPGYSVQLPGVVFDIVKIDGGKPGENPTVTFSVKNKKGESLDAGKMDDLRLVVAWPTSDYQVAIEEDVRKAQPVGNGLHSYRFNYKIPADAAGSGALGIQGFRLIDLKKPNGDIIKGQRDVGYNIVKYFPITDKNAVPRHQAVKIENCNVCHLTLATHGHARRNAEFCVMCHNPSNTDQDKRKAANGPMPPENIHYKRLIHRIHTGAAAGDSLIIYGGTPAKPGPVEMGDVRFPGDRRNCVKCHVPGANEPPLPAGLLPTLIPQKDGSVKAIPPITSACIACHTKEPAKIHMDTMTNVNGQEACVTCHGVDRAFAVEKVHRR
jgi:OmcA/MtrC family decaheme c-type cytochrome